MSVSQQWFQFNPFAEHTRVDPYPEYRKLRAEAPIYHEPDQDFYALTRYADIAEVLRDSETYTTRHGEDIDDTGSSLPPGSFIEYEPPLHDELRRIVQPQFGAVSIRTRLGDLIRREVERLLNPLQEREQFDIAQSFAWLLPINVGLQFLGVPVADEPRLRELIDASQEHGPGESGIRPNARIAVDSLSDYFRALMEERRNNPRDDIASVLARAHLDGGPLGDWAIGLMLLLLIGVSDTTAGLITNGIKLLADHPDVRRQLVADPALVPGAIEEILRFDSPIQNAKRVTTKPVLLRGHELPDGARVFLFFGSANRDEDRFEDAERFIVTRTPNPHLAFGAGVHRCIGAALARLEGEIAITEFQRRWPDFELGGTAVRHNSNVMRSFDALPIAVQTTEPR